VPVTAGETYNASAWIKTDGPGSVGFEIRWKDSETNSISGTSIGTISGTNDWTYLEKLKFEAPAGSAVGYFYFYISTGQDVGGIAYYDDCAFWQPAKGTVVILQ
jgi:hypothetical protein